MAMISVLVSPSLRAPNEWERSETIQKIARETRERRENQRKGWQMMIEKTGN
jgi:hypothetical protein